MKRNMPRDTSNPPLPVPGAAWLPLPKGKWCLIDEEDYAWAMQFNWSISDRNGKLYVQRNDRHGPVRTPSLHRELLGVGIGVEVDHINGDGMDNRKSNLRPCVRRQNVRNCTKTTKETRSKYKGLGWNPGSQKNPWVASIRVNGKSIYLGVFPTEELAAQAYDAAARLHFGEFAKPNFPCA